MTDAKMIPGRRYSMRIVRLLRHALHMTEREFAVAMKCTAGGTVKSWEEGITAPNRPRRAQMGALWDQTGRPRPGGMNDWIDCAGESRRTRWQRIRNRRRATTVRAVENRLTKGGGHDENIGQPAPAPKDTNSDTVTRNSAGVGRVEGATSRMLRAPNDVDEKTVPGDGPRALCMPGESRSPGTVTQKE